jgi:hypothetical protein
MADNQKLSWLIKNAIAAYGTGGENPVAIYDFIADFLTASNVILIDEETELAMRAGAYAIEHSDGLMIGDYVKDPLDNPREIPFRRAAEILRELTEKVQKGPQKQVNNIRAEAIEEYVEELKKRASRTYFSYSGDCEFVKAYQFTPEIIDNLAKEMTEGKNVKTHKC